MIHVVVFNTEVLGFRLATLLKKRLWYRHFFVNFAKFLKTLIYRDILKILSNICGI